MQIDIRTWPKSGNNNNLSKIRSIGVRIGEMTDSSWRRQNEPTHRQTSTGVVDGLSITISPKKVKGVESSNWLTPSPSVGTG